jgi:hypothetical protein
MHLHSFLWRLAIAVVVSCAAGGPLSTSFAYGCEGLVQEEASFKAEESPETLMFFRNNLPLLIKIVALEAGKGKGQILTKENECLSTKSTLLAGETCFFKQEDPPGATVWFEPH